MVNVCKSRIIANFQRVGKNNSNNFKLNLKMLNLALS
jgi:hypothetical protein